MVKPISLRLRHTQALTQARATLIRAGRGEELKQIHTAAVMREARRNVEKAQEQRRLKRCAVLAAQKAIVAVRGGLSGPRESRRRVRARALRRVARIRCERVDAAYRSGRSPDWLKMKNPACSAVKREAEEDWGR